MQPTNPTETSPSTSSEQPLFRESDLYDLVLALQQHIEQVASQSQQQIQGQLAEIWTAIETTLASLPQRMVSDHLSMEDPTGLPYYHPLHWFRSQWEFKLQGILEFTNAEAALSTTQEILDRLQPEIMALIALQQTEIIAALDQQIHALRQTLIPAVRSNLSDPRVIVSELINSQVPLAKLQLSEVDRFGFFQEGKRFVPSSLVRSTPKTVRPWYLLGLQAKQLPCYQLSIEQLQPVVEESLNRSFQHIKSKVTDYINHELHQQVKHLLATIK